MPAAESSGAQLTRQSRRVTVTNRALALSSRVTCCHPEIPPLATTAIPARFAGKPTLVGADATEARCARVQAATIARRMSDRSRITKRGTACSIQASTLRHELATEL